MTHPTELELMDAARKEVAIVTMELPEDLMLSKSALMQMMIVAFIRGVGWERGIDR